MKTIQIYDRDDLFETSFDEIPNRKDISIHSGHGGPGFRDVFEFVTRAKTRGLYTVDVELP